MKLKLNTAQTAIRPTAGIGNATASINFQLSHLALTAPSLRIPATPANRKRLRALREAELLAWDKSGPNAALRAEVRRSLATNPGEAWLMCGVTALAAGALVIGAASALDFVAHWDRFVSLVRAWIG